MKTPKSILERRRSIRIDEALPFKIGHAEFEIAAQTVNISLHGALCVVEKSLPLMTQLAVGLTLPTVGSKRGKTLHIKGVVVRRDKEAQSERYVTAIFFSDIKKEDQETLSRFITDRLASQG